jgi:AcrR family transcriptional regulator
MTRLPAEQRREQLLDTAVTLFATRGFSGATTAELARAAGVTEPIIYRHFKSKKDLFIAVIERTSDLTMGIWERQLRSAKDSAQRLRRLIAANPTISDRGRGIYRAILQAMTEIEDPDIKAALQHHVIKLHKFVTEEVVHAQEEGEVSKAFSPEITAWTLLHLGLGYGVLAPLGIEDHAIDDQGVRVRNVIESLMLSDKARARQDQMLKERRLPSESDADGSHDADM